MLRHVALLKFKAHEPETACQKLLQDLAELPTKVPEILAWSTGCNELNIEAAYDAAIVGDFEDKEALLRYFRNPAVQSVLQQMDRVCASRVSVDFVVA